MTEHGARERKWSYDEIVPTQGQAAAALQRMHVGLQWEALTKLRDRLLARWPSAVALRWGRGPDQHGWLRDCRLLDASGRVLAADEQVAIPFPLRGAIAVFQLEEHSRRIGGDGAPLPFELEIAAPFEPPPHRRR